MHKELSGFPLVFFPDYLGNGQQKLRVGKDDSETDMDVPHRVIVDFSACRPCILIGLMPTTTTPHISVSPRRPLRIKSGALLVIIRAIIILAPFRNIAVHIVQSKSIWGKTGNRCCQAVLPFSVARTNKGETTIRLLSPTIVPRATGAGGVFPFCFGGQSIVFTGSFFSQSTYC